MALRCNVCVFFQPLMMKTDGMRVGRENPKYCEEYLPHCHFAHSKPPPTHCSAVRNLLRRWLHFSNSLILTRSLYSYPSATAHRCDDVISILIVLKTSGPRDTRFHHGCASVCPEWNFMSTMSGAEQLQWVCFHG